MDGVLQTIPTQKVAAAQAKGSISSSFADTIQAFTVSGSSTYLPDWVSFVPYPRLLILRYWTSKMYAFKC